MFPFRSKNEPVENFDPADSHPPAAAGQRFVRCCFCHHAFSVPTSATILTCPKCSKRARVDDIVITGTEFHPKLETCGKIYIRRRAKLASRSVIAALGVEVLGEIEADTVRCGKVYLGPAAKWSGDCTTGSMNMDETASVSSGRFVIDPRLKLTAKN